MSNENPYAEALRRENAALRAEVERITEIARANSKATDMERDEWRAETSRLRAEVARKDEALKELKCDCLACEKQRPCHKERVRLAALAPASPANMVTPNHAAVNHEAPATEKPCDHDPAFRTDDTGNPCDLCQPAAPEAPKKECGNLCSFPDDHEGPHEYEPSQHDD